MSNTASVKKIYACNNVVNSKSWMFVLSNINTSKVHTQALASTENNTS